MESISIYGAGTWGCALALLLRQNGHNVTLWHYRKEPLQAITAEGRCEVLADFQVNPGELAVTTDLAEAAAAGQILVTALPAQTYGAFWPQFVPHLHPNHRVVNASKGVLEGMALLIHQHFAQVQGGPPHNYATLSGPGHAEEVARRLPTAVVIASLNPELAASLQTVFGNSWFRVYTNPDLLGVELAGAVKNVIAIASGVCDGIGYGVNTRAALITRGNLEITRLGVAMGASPLTFQGLAGIGDLVVTAMSPLSRNFLFGQWIGKGLNPEQAHRKVGRVVEGWHTVKAVVALSRKYQVDMPIASQVAAILFASKNPRDAVEELMHRDRKSET